ncbi:DUF3419 family protein [Thiorhodovibrio frisius]|uniref:DUF3419 family protein n=1 Tax=Thiorhodovibrio frisius TaxID=631362 RepID=UPI00022C65DE|nr:S-adenosylmethionine:diacylglycerol 3-amino-3-carboxypropyl transferase [Thiorhodovibrio frisius]
MTDFLRHHDQPISKYVLLDHMDWMSSYQPRALAAEWEWILARARGDARIIFRSAHAAPRYLQALELGPARGRLSDRLRFHPELAGKLQAQDRVHTYAGSHIADVRV